MHRTIRQVRHQMTSGIASGNVRDKHTKDAHACVVCYTCYYAPCSESLQTHGGNYGKNPFRLLLILQLPNVSSSALCKNQACCFLPLQVG